MPVRKPRARFNVHRLYTPDHRNDLNISSRMRAVVVHHILIAPGEVLSRICGKVTDVNRQSIDAMLHRRGPRRPQVLLLSLRQADRSLAGHVQRVWPV